MHAISKTFPGVRALKDVSLTVREGEVHAILGENGAGKSTLVNVLSGAFTDYDGVVEMDGERVSIHHPRDAQRLGIAMIHQELKLVGELSIADNLFLGRELRTRYGTIDRPRMHAAARALLDNLGLDLDTHRIVRQCRTAEQQLIEVAKALSGHLRVLIMDEPTSALADAEVERLFAVIRRLTRGGVAVIYISHRLEELYEMADRVTVLRDGAYIDTRRTAQTSRAELVQMMVGRPLCESFRQAEGNSIGHLPVLGVKHLSVRGDPHTRRTALHDVTLNVHAGEILGLAGLMGAGRTEVLETIYGVHPHAVVRGFLNLGGRPYQPRSPRHAIRSGLALIAEDRKRQSLLPQHTVRFNVSLAALPRFLRGPMVDDRRERAAVSEIVGDLRVKAPGLETPVSHLSGGNQQKVVLARCLLTRPDVLLLDEPTRGIDVNAKAEIYALMGALAAGGSGILMASSELPELLAMCDRILVLCEGRVSAEFGHEEATQEGILAAAMARETVLDAPAGRYVSATASQKTQDDAPSRAGT